MPMFRAFVPEFIRPWIYLALAFTFQFSGGIYIGALNQMTGATSFMREDLLMCLYANLAGMALYFPLLFRMKFRFTNKSLLSGACLGILVCNLVAPSVTCLPLLWGICFVEGICKIQGTFECMSNIQLWMTPERDFTVFFPVLHVVILASMQLSDLLTVWLAYHYHWEHTSLFMAGVMTVNLLMLTLCTRHFRMFKKFPLYGIDWLGGMLWAALLLEVAYFFDYGDWLDWLTSPVMQRLGVCILVTLALCLWRMFTVRHPFYEPRMWTYRHLVPLFVLIILVEGFLATEHVLEEVFYEEVMHYADTVSVRFDRAALAGILTGCAFAYWWMHIRRYSYTRLMIVGLLGVAAYLGGFYFTLSSDIHWTQLCLPIACRGFAYAVLSIVFLTSLEEIMSFRHFFQALSVFNMLHMVTGGVLGAAIFTRGLSCFLPDNLSRYAPTPATLALHDVPGGIPAFMEQLVSHAMQASIKQVYGLTLLSCIFFILLFLLYDMPARRQLKAMPGWRSVWKSVYAAQSRRKKHARGTGGSGAS